MIIRSLIHWTSLLTVLLFALPALSQDLTFTGQVIAAEGGKAIANATLYIAEQNRSLISFQVFRYSRMRFMLFSIKSTP